jgi:hypothetical protein
VYILNQLATKRLPFTQKKRNISLLFKNTFTIHPWRRSSLICMAVDSFGRPILNLVEPDVSGTFRLLRATFQVGRRYHYRHLTIACLLPKNLATDSYFSLLVHLLTFSLTIPAVRKVGSH